MTTVPNITTSVCKGDLIYLPDEWVAPDNLFIALADYGDVPRPVVNQHKYGKSSKFNHYVLIRGPREVGRSWQMARTPCGRYEVGSRAELVALAGPAERKLADMIAACDNAAQLSGWRPLTTNIQNYCGDVGDHPLRTEVIERYWAGEFGKPALAGDRVHV